MNISFVRTTHAVERFRPDLGRLYDVDMTARLAGVARRSVLVYCRWGFVAPATNPELAGWHFSAETIDAIRQIEHLRVQQGVNLPGIRIILGLLAEFGRQFPSR